MTLESLARTETTADQMAIKIRQRLVAMGQSQAALAKALGVPPMWLSDRLRGTVQLTVNDAVRIADTLGVALVDLLPESAKTRRTVTDEYLHGLIIAANSDGSTPTPTVAPSVPLPSLAAAAQARPLPGGPIDPDRRWHPSLPAGGDPPSGPRRPTPIRSPISR